MALKLDFSVIIPTYRRAEQLAGCLEAVAGQHYPHEKFQALVIDDGSTVPPEHLVKGFASRMNVQLIIQSHAGPAVARNVGAQKAKGELLAFTDDDCVPSPGWLRALRRRAEQAPGCAIGGHTINALIDNPYSAASELLIEYLYSYFNADPGAASFFTSNNICMPAEPFRAIGGFDASFPLAAGEDRELCDRWLRKGNRLVYEPEAVVYHKHPLTMRKFLRQHFNYGRGSAYYHSLRRKRAGGRSREPLTFYVNLLRHPFSAMRGRRALSAGVLLAAAQVANVVGSLWEDILPREDSKADV